MVAAASEQGGVVVNGMSCYARDGEFANSALVTSFAPGMFATPSEAFDFLSAIEKKIFLAERCKVPHRIFYCIKGANGVVFYFKIAFDRKISISKRLRLNSLSSIYNKQSTFAGSNGA